MLHILTQLRRELKLKLHVAHLNHQLRGVESDSDAKYVADLTCHLCVPATIEHRDVAAYRNQKSCSLEEAAREIRYDFLAEIARATGTPKVVVGHTRDDQVETILMHLLRGTGITGLRGLRPRSLLQYGEGVGRLEIIRPLLEITRQETLRYCERYQLKPQNDSSNAMPYFVRNRVRLELIPMLRNYNPSIDKALLRLAAIAADDISFIEEQASQLWNEVTKEENSAIYLDKKKIACLPRSLQRQIFRLALARLSGSLKDIEADHIEAMLNFLSKPAGRRLCLPHGLTLYAEYGRLVLTSSRASLCPLPLLGNVFDVSIPGETALPGWLVKTTVLQEPADTGENSYSARFDLDKIDGELSVRPRRPGDRFQPLGMSQTKKLQDFMVDARIPQAWRDRVPLVCSSEQILWVVGWRIDDRVKVTEATKRILRLEFERLI